MMNNPKARAQRLRERAARERERAQEAAARFRDVADRIPPGQPILVGHHSEGRHRRGLARMDRALREAAERARRAEELEDRAARAERYAQRLEQAAAHTVEGVDVGDEVIARWTFCYRYYQARGRIIGRTLREWKVQVPEPPEGWRPGHVFRIPVLGHNPRVSANNRVYRIE